MPQVWNITPVNPGQAKRNALATQLAGQQVERNRLAMATQQATQENLGPALTGDQNALKALMQSNPEMGMKVGEYQREQFADTQAEAEKHMAGIVTGLSALPEEQRPQMYRQAITKLQQNFPRMASDVPMDYDPRFFQMAQARYLPNAGEAITKQVYPGPVEGKSVGGSLVNPQTGEVMYQAPQEPAKPTSAMQEYQFAKSQGFGGSFMEYQQAKKGNGISYTAPDGSVIQVGGQAPGAPTRQLAGSDAKAVERAQADSAASESTEQLLTKAQELLDEGLDTGRFAPAVQVMKSLQSAIGFGGEEEAGRYEDFSAISKRLGAEALKLFGGSDTERELRVAIETSPSTDKTNTANQRIINRQMEALDVLQRKPDFQSAWIQRNGSLMNPDQETGEYFGKAWRRYQREEFGSAEPSGQPDPLGLR